MKKIEGTNESLMVSIRCTTYNQEPYIRQCLDGFVMQKTNFRFEAIVHDDASTDGTADIIREYAERYPDIIKPIFETENQYSKHDGSLTCIMNAHMHGKYIAVCEGDDYWVDPSKLQKQVDFLENNPEYGLVHTLARCYDEKQKYYIKGNLGENFSVVDDLFITNRIVTLTTCFRKKMYLDYVHNVLPQPSWLMGDYPFWIYVGLHSKIHFMNNITGVYRVLTESASHSKNLQKGIDFYLNAYSISCYFAIKYKKEYLLDSMKRQALYYIIYIHVLNNRRAHFDACRDIYTFRLMTVKLLILYLLSYCSLGRRLLMKRWN